MKAMPSPPLTGGGLKSAIKGSEVVSRNEEMYIVSGNLKVLQNYITILNEQGKMLGITRSRSNQLLE
jgi:hypothetical protein